MKAQFTQQPVKGLFISAIVLFMVGLRPFFSMFAGCVVLLSGERKIEPFAAKLAQERLAECDQAGKNLFEYSAADLTWATEGTESKMHPFSHRVIMTDSRMESQYHISFIFSRP